MPEDLAALLTLVWLVVRVYPSVFLQPRRVDKTLSAFFASVRLGPSVGADVTLQVRPLLENLGADSASNFVSHKTTPDEKQNRHTTSYYLLDKSRVGKRRAFRKLMKILVTCTLRLQR